MTYRFELRRQVVFLRVHGDLPERLAGCDDGLGRERAAKGGSDGRAQHGVCGGAGGGYCVSAHYLRLIDGRRGLCARRCG